MPVAVFSTLTPSGSSLTDSFAVSGTPPTVIAAVDSPRVTLTGFTVGVCLSASGVTVTTMRCCLVEPSRYLNVMVTSCSAGRMSKPGAAVMFPSLSPWIHGTSAVMVVPCGALLGVVFLSPGYSDMPAGMVVCWSARVTVSMTALTSVVVPSVKVILTGMLVGSLVDFCQSETVNTAVDESMDTPFTGGFATSSALVMALGGMGLPSTIGVITVRSVPLLMLA